MSRTPVPYVVPWRSRDRWNSTCRLEQPSSASACRRLSGSYHVSHSLGDPPTPFGEPEPIPPPARHTINTTALPNPTPPQPSSAPPPSSPPLAPPADPPSPYTAAAPQPTLARTRVALEGPVAVCSLQRADPFLHPKLVQVPLYNSDGTWPPGRRHLQPRQPRAVAVCLRS